MLNVILESCASNSPSLLEVLSRCALEVVVSGKNAKRDCCLRLYQISRGLAQFCKGLHLKIFDKRIYTKNWALELDKFVALNEALTSFKKFWSLLTHCGQETCYASVYIVRKGDFATLSLLLYCFSMVLYCLYYRLLTVLSFTVTQLPPTYTLTQDCQFTFFKANDGKETSLASLSPCLWLIFDRCKF